MLFLAHMLGRPVVDATGVRLGWVEDFVLTGLELFPKIDAVVLARRGQGAVFLPWDTVGKIDRSGVVLNYTRDSLPTSPLDDDAIFLRRDILDKQIVDIHGRKVVRVNDLQLVPIDKELRLVGADIGARGLLRRLGIEKPVCAVAKTIKGDVPERVIPWNYVEGLETEWPSLRLNVSHRRLRELPAADIADILTPLNASDREELLQHIDDETLADALPHLDDDVQADVILAMSDERASDIMEILPPDEAADVLGDIAEERAERILHLMEPEEAEDVRELLRYDDETAGGRMTTEFIAITDHKTTREAIAELRAQAPDAETIYYVYVTDVEGRLDGVLSLRDLITSSDETPISTLVRHDVIRVHVDDDQETVARTLNRYHLLAMPVVDDAGVLQGIVTVDDVLDVLHEEAEEDISRAAGTIDESDVLATPLEETGLRLPWVLTTAVIGMIAAIFLTTQLLIEPLILSAILTVLPVLVLLGVQIGGQSAAATQVGLGKDEHLRDILAGLFRHQWPIGIVISFVGAAFGGLMAMAFKSTVHPLAVISVMWIAILLDMLLGSFLPLLLHRMRLDPLLVSRPALAIFAVIIGIPLLALVL